MREPQIGLKDRIQKPSLVPLNPSYTRFPSDNPTPYGNPRVEAELWSGQTDEPPKWSQRGGQTNVWTRHGNFEHGSPEGYLNLTVLPVRRTKPGPLHRSITHVTQRDRIWSRGSAVNAL